MPSSLRPEPKPSTTYLALRPRGPGALAVAFGIAAYFLVAHDICHDVWPPPRVPVPLPLTMTPLTQSAQFIRILGLFAYTGHHSLGSSHGAATGRIALVPLWNPRYVLRYAGGTNT
jgi:hypothetical protein